MHRAARLNVIDIAVLGLCNCVVIVLVIPAFAQNQGKRDRETSNACLRDVTKALVLYANTNNDNYPGLKRDGALIDPSTEYRFEVLAKSGLVASSKFISPAEKLVAWGKGRMTRDHYSFAMAQIDDAKADKGRRQSWASTTDALTPAVSDRNTGVVGEYRSVWSRREVNDGWIGSVAYNDGHVAFEPSHIIPRTRLWKVLNIDDNLFEAKGPNDVLMTYSKGEISMPVRDR